MKEEQPSSTAKIIAAASLLLASGWPATAPLVDPFCGSGTTLIAALETGRKAIGIEIDERWVTVARQRLERWHAQGRLDFGTANRVLTQNDTQPETP
jgi:23S rRNA G2445 N2-methylase RlmL